MTEISGEQRIALNKRAMTSQGAKNPFVAFFAAAGIGGHSRVHAHLSRSTKGLRALLQGDSCGLDFSMPLAPKSCGTAPEALHVAELRELGQVGAAL